MREIKFRAWHKGVKKMMLVTELNWNTTGDQIDPGLWSITGIEHAKTKSGRDTTDFVRQEDYILLQFTGLKDKNGKEIYEGDIVKNHTGYIEKPVVWSEQSCGFTLGIGGDSGVPIWEREVIGNIYENPELLKESRI